MVTGRGRMSGRQPGDVAPFGAIPRATYRLQLNAGFTFSDATALVPYLARLGISHIYCSPYFRARPGSMHGYDIVDHNALNPELGTREDFETFVATLGAHGMSHILDFVPNHVGIMGAENRWWLDVLEHGRASRYATFFDIDWSPPNPVLADKLLVPALGEPYGTVLERGELRLSCDLAQGSLAVYYFQHCLPLDPRSYPLVLQRAAGRLNENQPDRSALLEVSVGFGQLPDRDTCNDQQARERDDAQARLKHSLAALLAASTPLRTALEAAIAALNGTPDDPASYDGLHELLERQCYRLADWRVASDDINYRRFFDVNDLAALRMEDDAVFDATHGLVLELIRSGKLGGLRIDHPDGLYDPEQYFTKLQRRVRMAMEQAGSRQPATGALPLYLLVEKILAGFERLPASWPVHGTTGYNFVNVVNGLFVDARNKSRIDRVYRNFTGDYLEWGEAAYDSKLLVLRTLLAAELNVLANQLARIAQADRHTRDFTLPALRQMLIEIIGNFPVYRTYVPGSEPETDRHYIDWAIGRTRVRSTARNEPLLQFIRSMMLGDVATVRPAMYPHVQAFAHKMQQVTAPVIAKGIEDTAMYRFTRLASLNEVGGEPENFGTSVRQFHADARNRARHWPQEMLATSTHDTKRSEDVRARINVLSEVSAAWQKSLLRWFRWNRSRRRHIDGQWAPGPHAEYLLYQTLLGTWPLEPTDDAAHDVYCGRIEQYMIKAAREAKRRTSWTNVNEEYEEALRQFIRQSLERREGNLFVAELDALARRMAPFGFVNGLAQCLCKLTAPGVPDIYQGTEIWDWSLVDPDNRRPVDFQQRRRLLEEVSGWSKLPVDALTARLGEALEAPHDGRCKLHVTWNALQLRRREHALFRDGRYVPLKLVGERAAHVLAFARELDGTLAITVVPRLCVRLVGERGTPPLGAAIWSDTRIELPDRLSRGAYRNLLDGRQVAPAGPGGRQVLPVATLLAHWPCALLHASAG